MLLFRTFGTTRELLIYGWAVSVPRQRLHGSIINRGIKTGLCKQFGVTFLAAEIHLEYMVLMWTDILNLVLLPQLLVLQIYSDAQNVHHSEGK